MIATSHLLSGFLMIVLTVSVLHQVESRTLKPSLIHSLLQDVGKIGKKAIEFFCKPRPAMIMLPNKFKAPMKIGHKINNCRKTNLVRTSLTSRNKNILRKTPRH